MSSLCFGDKQWDEVLEYTASFGGINVADASLSSKRYINSENKNIKGIGYSSAGPLDQISGKYINPPNLTGWHNKSLIPIIKNNLSVIPRVGHDATLAALAETKFGEFSGSENV